MELKNDESRYDGWLTFGRGGARFFALSGKLYCKDCLPVAQYKADTALNDRSGNLIAKDIGMLSMLGCHVEAGGVRVECCNCGKGVEYLIKSGGRLFRD